MWYRIRVTWTYSTVAQAQATESALLSTLATYGRSEVPSRNNTAVDLLVEPVPIADGPGLYNALTPAWNRTGRSTTAHGKASIALRDEDSL